MITNCPNCGAPIEGSTCKYCGTPFIDLACIHFNRPAPIKMRYGNRVIQMVAYPERAELQCEMSDSDCCRDISGRLVYHSGVPQYRVTLELVTLGDVTFIDDPELWEGCIL